MVIILVRQKLEFNGPSTVARVGRNWGEGVVIPSVLCAHMTSALEHYLQDTDGVARYVGSWHLEEGDSAAGEGPRAPRAESADSLCA